MSFLKKLFGNKKNKPHLSQPVYIGKRQKGKSIFEVYKVNDAESAKAFLLTKKIENKQYYIVVDTQDGNWGMDITGIYLERLRPWQTDLSLSQSDGIVYHPTITDNIIVAAQNISDNYITKIMCGTCKQEWLDGVRYHNTTIVRCPSCKTYNKINTENFTVMFKREVIYPKHKSIAMLFYDDSDQAQNKFAKIAESCNRLGGLTEKLTGTTFELCVAPTSVRIIAIRATDDVHRNHALMFISALGVFGDSSPQATEQNNPDANSYSEFNDLLNKCALIQIINFDDLPKAKPSRCIICNGTGQLKWKSPHTEFQVHHHCQFCDGSGNLSVPVKPTYQGDFYEIIREADYDTSSYTYNVKQDDSAHVTFVQEMIKPSQPNVAITYQIYRADSSKAAHDFLTTHSVTQNLLHIVVETPDGKFCRDINGIYKAKQ